MYTLNTIEQHAVVYAIDRESYNCGANFARKMGISEDGINSTLNAQGPSAVAAPVYSSSKASFFTSAEEELANTLVATDYKDPPIINDPSSYHGNIQQAKDGKPDRQMAERPAFRFCGIQDVGQRCSTSQCGIRAFRHRVLCK